MNVSTQCLFYDVPSKITIACFNCLCIALPEVTSFHSLFPLKPEKNDAKFCTVVINKHPAVVIMTFHVTALPWFTVWICSKPAADGLAQLLPLKLHHAERFQKGVKLSGHISRCFLWNVCAGEERSTLDINNSPSDKDCWREPCRLQIPMWLHDTQLTCTEASSQSLRYSLVCLDGPLLGSSGVYIDWDVFVYCGILLPDVLQWMALVNDNPTCGTRVVLF